MANGIDFELLHNEIIDKNNKRAVLLFHGMTGSPFEMKKYGEFLYRCGYDVFSRIFTGNLTGILCTIVCTIGFVYLLVYFVGFLNGYFFAGF